MELETWFGGDARYLEQQEHAILTHPMISNDRDTQALEKYAMKLRNTVANMKVSGVQPGRELYLSATQKIPRAMLVRFFERPNDTECDIEKFSDWLVEPPVGVPARLKRVAQWLFVLDRIPAHKSRAVKSRAQRKGA